MAPVAYLVTIALAAAGMADVVDAKPLLSPGRHAAPKLANILSNAKRDLHSFYSRYYGTEHGLSKPPALPQKRSTIPAGWTYHGCIRESYNERLLQGFGFSSQELTPLLCLTECAKLNYPIAGMEYGDECYCGSEYNGNGGAPKSDDECSIDCTGDDSVKCGNAWVLSLYTYNMTSLPTCQVANTSTTVSLPYATATATLDYSSTAAIVSASSSSEATSLITSAAAPASTVIPTTTVVNGSTTVLTATELIASTLTSASASVSTGASTTISAPVSTTTHTDTLDASEWYSLGCAIDSETRILADYASYNIEDLTIDSCLSLCEDEGYAYAGLEFGEECHCGNSVASSTVYESGSCEIACTGNSTENCGGYWHIELFELISSATNCSTTTNAYSTAAAASWTASASLGVNSTSIYASSSTASSLNTSTSALTRASASASATSVSASVSDLASASSVSSAASVSDSTSATSASVTASASASVTSAALPASASESATTASVSTASVVASSVPSSSATHNVWAHHMVGNTYPYTSSDWATDIEAAADAAIDGFALNVGSDSWQTDRIASAYAAAKAYGTSFKMFLSLDMTSLSCSSSSDATTLVNLVKEYASHPNQATHKGKVLVSTFAGNDCTFGQTTSTGWQTNFVDALTSQSVDIFFVPSIFSDVSTFGSNTWMDGELNWNSAWPSGSSDISTSTDQTYIDALGDKEYMPAVSPFFFTHFGSNSWNKNWLYRGDNWLYCTRWEQIIAMRATVSQTEILTWNDYGESSYIGPIAGALPSGSSTWVDGYEHSALNELTRYYATAFKTGAYPTVTEDKIILWSRPHHWDATATSDSVGKPSGYENTDDYLYAVVLSTGSATVSLTAGSNTESFAVTEGLNKIKIASSAGSISATMTREGSTVASYTSSSFSWTETPTTYNYNYFVGSSS